MLIKSRSLKFKLVALGGVGLMGLMLFLALYPATSSSTSVKASSPLAQAAKGKMRAAVIHDGAISRKAPFFSPGTVEAADLDATSGSLTGVDDSLGCSVRNPIHDGSRRVNQDCTFRRQAEELIK